MRDKKGAKNPNWKGGKVPKICEECGADFSVVFYRRESARFCSMACANRKQSRQPDNTGERKARIEVLCAVCENPIRLLPCQVGFRKTCSEGCSFKLRSTLSRATAYSKSVRGRRADLGTPFFRSSWEANYARYLNSLQKQGLILSWEFEPTTFWFEKIRRGVRSYTPDFKILDADGSSYYVEVKGWMDARSKTKLKRMKKYHPKIEVRVVDGKAYKEIQKKFGALIPEWESYRSSERSTVPPLS